MSNLYWSTAPAAIGNSLPEMLERVHPLGVRWQHKYRGPATNYRFDDGMLLAEIGIITVRPDTGIIAVYPSSDIGLTEQRVLVGRSQRAFERTPCRDEGWRHTRKGGVARWRTAILVPVQRDGFGELIANHHESMVNAGHDAVDKAMLEVVDQ